MKIYKISQEDAGIKYLGNYTVTGAHFVMFQIKDNFWAYQLSFPDWVNKVKQIAARSSGKALAWSKEKASASYKVTKDFPSSGSILEEGQ